MIALLDIAIIAISIYIWVIIINVALSWLLLLNVVNRSHKAVYMVADFTRRATEPVLKPIRAMMPRTGGMDLSPVVLLLLLMYAQDVLVTAQVLVQRPNPSWPLILLTLPLIVFIMKLIELFMWLVLIDAILSWLIAFNIINRHNRIVFMVAMALRQITEPLLWPIRQKLPPVNGFDIAPIILYVGLWAIQYFVFGGLYTYLAKLFAL